MFKHPATAAEIGGASACLVQSSNLGDIIDADPCPLQYLGYLVVLGIVPCEHPLVVQRIFQTVSGAVRLYVMPFSLQPHVVMWQLSFPMKEDEARALSRDVSRLHQYLITLCEAWHDPVPELLRTTSQTMITSHLVLDRLPLTCEQLRLARTTPIEAAAPKRVTLLGDAGIYYFYHNSSIGSYLAILICSRIIRTLIAFNFP